MPPFVALVTLVLSTIAPVAAQQPPPQSLKIVVLEGEGGVNIIQQKTAVRPLIEVRDRNNVPVAGASVTFTIGGGQSAAFAGGVQTLTVTTNAAGQAAASGLNALSSGAFQIQVQAAYQGQVATAAISQTNFATAAAAAQAGAGAGAGGGSGAGGAAGGAAGGGGGISATTIGIIGAAVAGGAVAATQVAGGSDEETVDGYNGSFSGQFTLTSTMTSPQGIVNNCVFTEAATGTVTIDLVNGTSSGRANFQLQYNPIAVSGNCTPGSQSGFSLQRENTPVTGGPSALTFSGTAQVGALTHAMTFTGSLSGNNINGTISLTVTPQGPPNQAGSATFPVTLVGPRP